MTPKEILAMTQDSVILRQVAIRDETKRIATYEQALVQLGPEDPLRFQIEALHELEQERLQKSQALLAELILVRTAATEALEKLEG